MAPMRRPLGVFVALCVGLSFSGGVKAATHYPYSGWRTIDTPHFSVHYYRDLEETAKKAAGILEDVYAKLSPKYRWKPWGRTQVVLTSGIDAANGLASTLPYNWLILHTFPPQPESSIGTYDDWLKTLITHEFTHILHMDAYGGFWRPFHWIFGKFVAPAGFSPAWIKEGAATLEETLWTQGGRGRSAYGEMLLRTAVLNKQFPTIDRAAGVHWKWPGNLTPYIFGVKFLDHLRERYGEEKLQDFHRRTQRSFWVGAINHQAKKVFGKSFYKLWKEWEVSLEQKYQEWEKDLRESWVTELSPYIGGEGSFSLPTFSPDGKKLAYLSHNPKRGAILRLKDLETGKEESLGARSPEQMSFTPDGEALIYSAMSVYKRHFSFYDLYRLDLKTKKPKRLTTGARARDPDVHPGGKKFVYVAHTGDRDTLKVYDFEEKASHELVEDVPPYTQFAHPRYSPDGSEIALIRFQNGEGWDLCIYGADGRFKRNVTRNGLAIDSRPVWSPDGRRIVFSSALNGVFNLYAYDREAKNLQRLTRVTTGLFQPALSRDGKRLLARYYHGEGYDIREVPFQFAESAKKTAKAKQTKGKKGGTKKSSGTEEVVPSFKAASPNLPISPDWRLRKYNSLGQSFFLPRYILPGAYYLGNGFLFSGATGGRDPLGYHRWFAGLNYRTDAKHVGYFAEYAFTRFWPLFGVGIDDAAVDLGTLAFTNGNSYHFFEEHRRAYAFFALPLGQSSSDSPRQIQGHWAGLSYFYEDRDPVTKILPAEAAALNLGIFAGFQATYSYKQGAAYPASISPVEKGRRLTMTGAITDARLGSNERNEQRIFTGDFREYLPLGGNHVMALRLAGGIASGDTIVPGTFSLGGSLGEGLLSGGGSSRYFSLRGLPVSFLIAERAMLLSAEYRLPLVSVQRGLGTWPIFLNNLHLGFFADCGDAWSSTDGVSKEGLGDFFNDFLLGTGLELRADLVVWHGFPVTGRLGYGIIVANRDRLGNTKDPLLNNRVSKGVLILQWGTSF